MSGYIVFGAGDFGKRALELLPRAEITFFIDNNIEKQKIGFHGFPVYSLMDGLKRRNAQMIIIAVSEKYVDEIIKQLEENAVRNYKTFRELQVEVTRKKIQNRIDYISTYKKAIQWIKNNSIPGEGIINNSNLRKSYPEVTGYYIPTLIRWGYRDLAVTYAKWLCSIQKEDGSWYDTEGKEPYIFDTAQILKGLLAIRKIYTDVDDNIIKGCEWILSRMTEEGQLLTPTKEAWGEEKTCSELIHVYCLSPLMEAAEIFDKPVYKEKAYKILSYYKENYLNEILNFNLLSHFYAYVVEGMLDMGEVDLAIEAMENIKKFQKNNGAIPGYRDVQWTCSTGLFQLALIWFRLGNIECGSKTFEYACKLQNETGGWYGSYLSEESGGEANTYFASAEISWVVKYFLDALYYKNLAVFEKQAPLFLDEIKVNDGRYGVIKNVLINTDGLDILDIGCGKGRYLKNLTKEIPNKYYACDLSLSVLEHLDCEIAEKKQGSLTNIPYEDNKFEVVYTCEELEHAVDIESAVAEMARVTKENGKIIVVDKNKDKLGFLEMAECEQWFDIDEFKDMMLRRCCTVEVRKEIDYDNQKSNGLFCAWIGTVKK